MKQHAVIYLKGHINRSLKDKDTASCSDTLFQLADICIGLLLSTSVQASLKVHAQEALTAILRADGRAATNVKVTPGLFEDFLHNRLKISELNALENYA